MRIGEIDYSREIVKPVLNLCKPNRVVIDILDTAYDVEFDELLGAINELSFKLPIFTEKQHQIVRNESVDIIRGRYIVLMELGDYREYFLINSMSRVGSDRDEYLEVKCLSLVYELNDKLIRGYDVVSYNCSSILKDLLSDTIWKIGYIDSEFDLQFRSFEVSSSTVFEAVVELAKTFNALLYYDTEARTVSLYLPTIGENKGFTVSYGKYLESINQEENSEEIITRLEMYGKEDISIRDIIPSGQPYVEDFSYYKYPYEETVSETETSYSPSDILSNWSKIGLSYDFTTNGNSLTVNNTLNGSKIISNNELSKDFRLEFSVNNAVNTVGAKYGVVFGYEDIKNYYYFTHERSATDLDTSLKLYKVSNGIAQELKVSERIKRWSYNIEYLVKLEVLNGFIQITIDNVLGLDYEDNNFTSGEIGFYSEANRVNITNITKKDIDWQVLNHSEFLSDELCYYLNRYEELLANSEGEFTKLVDYRTNYNEQLSVLDDELSVLNTDLKKLLDERDILNTRIARNNDSISKADNVDSPTDFLESTKGTLVAQRDAKLVEIDNKTNEVNAKKSEIAVVESQFEQILHKIDLYRVKIGLENNFPAKLLHERKQHEVTKQWQDSNIIESEALLKEGLKVFEEYRKQKITASINIVNFLAMITEQINWDKLVLADVFNIEHERLGLIYDAKITGINYKFENNDIQVTVSNVKDIYSNKNKFLDMLYQSSKISSSVSMKEWEWDLALENRGSINEIINNIWDANRQSIIGAKDQVVEISDRGLIIRDESDPMKYLVAINGMLALTNDGGATFKHAITTEGIVGERIYGKVIMGVNLAIEDESGILIIQGSRGSIYNREGILRMKFGLVEEDGLCGESFGLISENEITQVKVTDCEGFVINRKTNDTTNYPSGWEKVFWTNTDGTVFAHDLIVSDIKVVQNKEWNKYIMDSELGYFDLGFFSKIVKDGKLTTDEKLNLITELRRISSSYMAILAQASKYQYVSRDDSINFDGAFSTGNGDFTRTSSTTSLINTSPLDNAYLQLISFMSNYVKVTSTTPHKPLNILTEHEMTETTSDLGANREKLILLFKNYYDEYDKLSDKIEDIIVYQGISMGQNYNNVYIGEHGLIVVRSDGQYRAYLNATNGLALQKWENGVWVSKLFATLGDPMWEDGTLYAEGLVTKNLRIVDAHMNEKITFDWYDGITIYGDDAIIYLNANDAIRITDLNGDSKFWVDTNGFLYAKDITTHNLSIVDGNLGEKIVFDHEDGITIYGNHGEVIYLNANDAIRIKVNGEDRFWVGTDGNLYARKLFIMNGELDENILAELEEDDSFISDLTVTRLRTLDVNDPYNYVHIKQKFLRFMTKFGTGDERAKYEMYFEGSGVDAYPVAVWGTGSGNNINNNKAKQYKTPQGFFTEYIDEAGEKHSINLNTDVTKSIELKSPKTILIEGGGGSLKMNNSLLELKFGINTLTMTSSGIKLNGTRIDLN